MLTHPSSVDSITTSAGQEDHVSMGGFAARKALEVVQHVEQVLAIELLAACQALEFHRPKKTTAPLEEVYKLVRTVAKYVVMRERERERLRLIPPCCTSGPGTRTDTLHLMLMLSLHFSPKGR